MRRRGVQVCCPIHDAVLIQAPIAEIESAVVEAQAAMSSASAAILNGYGLRCDCVDDKEAGEGDIVRFPGRFFSADGKDLWSRVQSSMKKLQDAATVGVLA
jgi:DNA polymerase I